VAGESSAYQVAATVYEAVEEMVAYGLKHRDLRGIEAIGIDELARHRRQHFTGRMEQAIDSLRIGYRLSIL
jgi:hypothetical protein